MSFDAHLRLISSMALCVITICNIVPQNKNAVSTSSGTEKASSIVYKNPEIDHLTTAKGDLRKKLDSWDTWNLRAISLAGFAAVCLIITSLGFSNTNRKFVKAADDLDKAKDAQVVSDLSNKDVEISGANKLAGIANENAGKANLKAAEANERAEGSNKIAAEANTRAEELKVQNLATETRLEKERQTRLELEKSLTPRVLKIVSSIDDRATYAPLQPFAGIKVIFNILPDAEAQRAANNIGNLIKFAGWKVE